jgi:hypothetical protein
MTLCVGWVDERALANIGRGPQLVPNRVSVGNTGLSTPTTDNTLKQTFVVPTGSSSLSLWYYNVCASGDNNAVAWFTATLQNTGGTTLATIVPQTCVAPAWHHVTASLTSFAGQTVVLVLTNHDDNDVGDGTYTYVDDIGVE